MNFAAIKLIILDVDGVLTDGRLLNGPTGEVAKLFNTRDGFAIKLWQRLGGKVAILSGRASEILAFRAHELGIECVHMGSTNKGEAYTSILVWAGCEDDATAYIGDDFPDLPPMRRCAFPVAVSNAAPEIKRHASYITARSGGEGAVAEAVELILRKQQRWAEAVDLYMR